MLALVSSYFTPTSLFLFLNLVIGTIVVTSRLASHKNPSPHQPENQQQQLTRAPSLLQRVRSIDLHSYKFSPFYSECGSQTAMETHDPPPQLERTPSLLERVKSIKFSSFHRSDPETETEQSDQTDTDPVPDMGRIADAGAKHHAEGSKSDSRVAPKKQAQGKMKKSASEETVAVMDEEQEEDSEKMERRRPATARIERKISFGDEGVDAKADDFINKFKQQLRLQRLDSFLRYKELLKGKQN